jgi:hypothetical protein
MQRGKVSIDMLVMLLIVGLFSGCSGGGGGDGGNRLVKRQEGIR